MSAYAARPNESRRTKEKRTRPRPESGTRRWQRANTHEKKISRHFSEPQRRGKGRTISNKSLETPRGEGKLSDETTRRKVRPRRHEAPQPRAGAKEGHRRDRRRQDRARGKRGGHQENKAGTMRKIHRRLPPRARDNKRQRRQTDTHTHAHTRWPRQGQR